MAACAENATHQCQQAGGFPIRTGELAFIVNILPLTAKSGSYCDAEKQYTTSSSK
jgi:hypothetical protein